MPQTAIHDRMIGMHSIGAKRSYYILQYVRDYKDDKIPQVGF